MRMSLGVHLTLMDLGDPHSDKKLMECFTNNLKPLPPPPDFPDEATEAATRAGLIKSNAELIAKNVVGAEKCRAESRKRNWNKSSWIVAAAPAWISPTGETKDFRHDGGGVWTSLSYGFEGLPKGLNTLKENSQLIFHARYRNNEMVPEPNMQGKFFKQDSFFLGGKANVGNENSTVSFEGVFQRLRRQGAHFDNSSRLAFGIERKIAENIWFHLAFGSQTATPDDKKSGFILTAFKWGFSEKRTFQTPGQPLSQ